MDDRRILSFGGHAQQHLRRLAAELTEDTSTTFLRLSRTAMSGADAQGFASALLSNTTLVHLDLSFNSIDDAGALALGKMLAVNTTLRHLDLRFNPISRAGMAGLIWGLRHSFTLTGLDVGNDASVFPSSSSSSSPSSPVTPPLDPNNPHHPHSHHSHHSHHHHAGDAGVRETLRDLVTALGGDASSSSSTCATCSSSVAGEIPAAAASTSSGSTSSHSSPRDTSPGRLRRSPRALTRHRAPIVVPVPTTTTTPTTTTAHGSPIVSRPLLPEPSQPLGILSSLEEDLPEGMTQFELVEFLLHSNRVLMVGSERATLGPSFSVDLRFRCLHRVPALLHSFTHLAHLDLSNNQLTQLSDDVCHLKHLHVLLLNHNQLTSLPDRICRLKRLRQLCVAHNQLTTLPDSLALLDRLEELFLDSNKLTRVPPTLGALRRLKRLSLRGNAVIKFVAASTSGDRSPEACVSFVRSFLQGDSSGGSQVRIVVFGQVGVGKSTLIECLQQSCQRSRTFERRKSIFIPTRSSEHGREAVREHTWVWKHDRRNVRTAVAYDLDGESAHLLSPALIRPCRTQIHIIAFSLADMEGAWIAYWVQHIMSRSAEARILLVGTHADAVSKSDLEATRSFILEEFIHVEDPVVVGFIPTENSVRGVHALRTEIQRLTTTHMKHPISWDIFGRLAKAAAAVRPAPILSYDTIRRIATRCFINESTRANALMHLRDTGALVGAATGPFVTSMSWLCDKVATLLPIARSHQNKIGLVPMEAINVAWFFLEPVMRQQVLMFMEHLCILHCAVDYVLIPPLLPVLIPQRDERVLAQKWASYWDGPQLARYFHCEGLVSSLLHALVCQLVSLGWRLRPLWRHGALLTQANVKCLVELDPTTNSLEVSVRGKECTLRFFSIMLVLKHIWERFTERECPVKLTHVFIPCTHCLQRNALQPQIFQLKQCEAAILQGHASVNCKDGAVVALYSLAPDLAMNYVPHFNMDEVKRGPLLGEGGFASVYECEYGGAKRAIKVLTLAQQTLTAAERYRLQQQKAAKASTPRRRLRKSHRSKSKPGGLTMHNSTNAVIQSSSSQGSPRSASSRRVSMPAPGKLSRTEKMRLWLRSKRRTLSRSVSTLPEADVTAVRRRAKRRPHRLRSQSDQRHGLSLAGIGRLRSVSGAADADLAMALPSSRRHHLSASLDKDARSRSDAGMMLKMRHSITTSRRFCSAADATMMSGSVDSVDLIAKEPVPFGFSFSSSGASMDGLLNSGGGGGGTSNSGGVVVPELLDVTDLPSDVSDSSPAGSPSVTSRRMHSEGGDDAVESSESTSVSSSQLHELAETGSAHTMRKVLRPLCGDYEALNVRDAAGWTPLHVAAMSGYLNIVRQLLEAGADASVVNLDGASCLHCLVRSQKAMGPDAFVDVVHRMIEAGAPVNGANAAGETPLHIGTMAGLPLVVNTLCLLGANPNARSLGGNTPLHCAAHIGHAHIVQTLTSYGADPNALNESHASPSDVAQTFGHDWNALMSPCDAMSIVASRSKMQTSFRLGSEQQSADRHHKNHICPDPNQLHAALGLREMLPCVDKLDGDRLPIACVLTAMCTAVRHLHSFAMVHGCVSPSAVVLDGDGTPYITQMNLAQRLLHLSTCVEAPDLSQVTHLFGADAVTFLSPESVRVKAPTVCHASDVWSLGALAWSLGWGGRSIGDPDMVVKVLRDPSIDVMEQLFHIPEEGAHLTDEPHVIALQNLVAACCVRDPKQRPLLPTLMHLVTDLKEAEDYVAECDTAFMWHVSPHVKGAVSPRALDRSPGTPIVHRPKPFSRSLASSPDAVTTDQGSEESDGTSSTDEPQWHSVASSARSESTDNDSDLGRASPLHSQPYVEDAMFDDPVPAYEPVSDSELAWYKDFCREVSMMYSLRHENVIRLCCICTQPPAIMMEHMELGDLYSFLQKDESKELTGWQQLDIVLDVAKGMAFLHRQNPPVLHSDLKSPNVLLTRRDGRIRATVTDFGLSKVLVHFETSGNKVDNPTWLAPEVLAKQKFTRKVDVYSFGVIMWEVVTGDRFMADKPFATDVEDAVLAGDRPFIPRTLWAEVRNMIKRCWAQQAYRRPEFVDIVEGLLELTSVNPKEMIPQVVVLRRAEERQDFYYERRRHMQEATWSEFSETSTTSPGLQLPLQLPSLVDGGSSPIQSPKSARSSSPRSGPSPRLSISRSRSGSRTGSRSRSRSGSQPGSRSRSRSHSGSGPPSPSGSFSSSHSGSRIGRRTLIPTGSPPPKRPTSRRSSAGSRSSESTGSLQREVSFSPQYAPPDDVAAALAKAKANMSSDGGEGGLVVDESSPSNASPRSGSSRARSSPGSSSSDAAVEEMASLSDSMPPQSGLHGLFLHDLSEVLVGSRPGGRWRRLISNDEPSKAPHRFRAASASVLTSRATKRKHKHLRHQKRQHKASQPIVARRKSTRASDVSLHTSWDGDGRM